MKRRSFCALGLALAAGLALPVTAQAKAAFYGKLAMIEQAEIIAIVNITKVAPASEKRGGWTYSQTATAQVEQVLKGALPAAVTLYGGEDFICAQVRYQPGRHLVFLRKDRDLLCGVNWHLGVRPIKDAQLEWFADDEKLKLQPTALKEVLRQIKAALSTKPK